MTIPPPDSTVNAMRLKVRRLTVSSGESSLSTYAIDQALNTFIQQDFPYAIKLDQMRSIYTFYTSPNVERYPLNVNFNQGIRSPVYFEGIQGYFYKDRQQFYQMWPRWPSLTNPISGDGTTQVFNFTIQPTPFLPNEVTLGGVDSAGNAILVSDDGNGNMVYNAPIGQTSIPPQTNSTVQNVNQLAEPFPDGTEFYNNDILAAATIDDTAIILPFTLNFYLDFGLQNETKYTDDGAGNIVYVSGPFGFTSGTINYTTGQLFIDFSAINNPGATIPASASFSYRTSTFIPGMPNQNTGNPGDILKYIIGSVNYVTGVCSLNFQIVGIIPAKGSLFNLWVSQYTVGRPYCLLFWNNELTVRPVPDKTYKVEVETYLTPVQFLETSDVPILNQWWQYIAYGASMEILRERQDYEGVENLREGFMRQEALVLERQGVEEIGQRNATIFSESTASNGWNQGGGWPY